MNDLLNVESLALMVAQFLCIFPPHPPVFNKPFQGVSHVRTDQMTQNPPPPQQYGHHDEQYRLCSKSQIKPHSQPVKYPANQEYDLYYF